MSKSYRELLAEQQELNARIEAAKQKEREQAIAAIRNLMAQFDISAGELATKHGAMKRGQAPAKYRDPVTGATWSGKGRVPHWIAGNNRDAFLI